MCEKALIPAAARKSAVSRKTRKLKTDKIFEFYHEEAEFIRHENEILEGEGEFLIKFKGRSRKEWMSADKCKEVAHEAVHLYFKNKRDERQKRVNEYMDKLTHISSLDDIICEGIEDETDTHFKLRIEGPTENFMFELDHPEWGKHISPHYEIVREGDAMYVWAEHLHAEYHFNRYVRWVNTLKMNSPAEEEDEIDFETFRDTKKFVIMETGQLYRFVCSSTALPALTYTIP